MIMNKLRILLLLFACLSAAVAGYSQERKAKFTAFGGPFHAGKYTNRQHGNAGGFDLSYYINNRFFLTAHFSYGANRFFEDFYSNAPDERMDPVKETNAKVVLNNIGLLAGYRYPITEWMSISGQLGISQFIEAKKYIPVLIQKPEPDDHRDYLRRFDKDWFSIAFPLKISIDFVPCKFLEVGLVAGCYIAPDYRDHMIVGKYIGPQIGFVF